MLHTTTAYRTPTLDEFVPGFSFEKLTDAGWVPASIQAPADGLTTELYSVLIGTRRVRVAYELTEELPDPEPSHTEKFSAWVDRIKARILPFLRMGVSAFISVAHIIVALLCFRYLNFLDAAYPPEVDGQVMGEGTKNLVLLVSAASFHCSAMVITSLIHWTSTNFQAYIYQNPFVRKHSFDFKSDLANPTDPAAAARIQWFRKNFFTFYFVSVSIMALMYVAKIWLISR